MKAEIKTLTITLGKRKLEFTIEEAEALMDALNAKLGRVNWIAPIVIERERAPDPIYPIYPVWGGAPAPTPLFPQITCSSAA